MKYYLDTNNTVWAYESDGSQDHLIGDKQLISEATAIQIGQQKQAEMEQALMATMTYQEKRRREYPSIGDQLDALYHAGLMPSEMAAEIAAVKAKYPKV